jgi:hypothetical protein
MGTRLFLALAIGAMAVAETGCGVQRARQEAEAARAAEERARQNAVRAAERTEQAESVQHDNAAQPRNSDVTHVVTVETVYYMSGPQQARPPEGRLEVGTKVTIIRDAGSYTLVRTEGGVEAYVASDSIEPLADPAAPDASPLREKRE